MRYEALCRSHAQGVVDVCRVLEWPSYSRDADDTYATLSAPGSTTVVALDAERVVGFAQILSDGRVQAHLSLVGVLPEHRGSGIGKRLVRETFGRSGGKWLDLVSEPGSEPFYRSFTHQERVGFRVYPLGPPGNGGEEQ